MSKYSKKAQKAISAKMHKMKGEDRPQAQKVAIAMSEARSKGLKVPKEKKGRADVHCEDHEHLTNQSRRGSNISEATKKWNK
jgi:hypothetical protein